MKPLPENFLKCMTPEARKSVGQRTAAEVMANGVATSERALQKQIVGLLRLKGIEPIVSRMDRRTSNNVGTPDILFSVRSRDCVCCDHTTWACAWEVKMPSGVMSREQAAMAIKLSLPPNGWQHSVIRSVDQALAELKAMGVK